MNVLGQPMLILGTHDIALDLLEKRSALYSDRSQSTMVHLYVVGSPGAAAQPDAVPLAEVALTGSFRRCPTVPGGDATDGPSTNSSTPTPSWSSNRCSAPRSTISSVASSMRPTTSPSILGSTLIFLRVISLRSTRLTNFSVSVFAAMIMRATYGIQIAEKDDKYVKMAEDGIAAFSNLLVPGKYLVEQFPVLRFLPKWMPGARFLCDAADATTVVHGVRDVPWSRTLEAMVRLVFVYPECLAR